MSDRTKPWVTPTLERPAGDFVHRFAFPEVHVLLRLTNLYADRGDFTFNLWVQAFSPDGEPLEHVHWSKFNIASASTRTSMAKTLAAKQPELLDWDRALEYVCTLTYQTLLEGEPHVDLDEVDVDEGAANELLAGFAPIEQPTTIFAAGGSLKSLTALIAGMAVRLGATVGPFAPVMQAPVLYVDYETIKQEQAKRIRALARGLGLEGLPKIHYLRPRLPLVAQRDQIGRLIDRLGVRFMVIDSIVPAVGDDMDESKPVNDFFDALLTFEGVTVLIVGHVSKAVKEKKAPLSSFGSIFVENRSRAMWHVENVAPANGDRFGLNRVVLTCTKANNSPPGARLALTVRWREDGAIEVGSADVRRDPELVARFGSNSARTRQLLRDGIKRTYKEIAAELGISANSAKTAVNRLGDEIAVFSPERPGGEVRVALTAYPDPTPIRRALDEVDVGTLREELF